MFPRNQRDLTRASTLVKLTGPPRTTANLTLRLASAAAGRELVLTSNADGEVLDTAPDAPLRALRGQPVLDRWRVTILAADNPHLVQNGVLDLGGLDDLMVFFEYAFAYR
jgi:hypothetical protein